MKQVTAKELRELDPKRFEREYYKWCEYAHDYEWWDYIDQMFTDKMAAVGARVDKIYFSLSHSQGDCAGFEGRVDVSKWMHHAKYDTDRTFAEAFPALYIAVVQDGAYVIITSTHRNRADLEYRCHIEYTEPDGVFQHLDEEAWRDLLIDQEYDADLEANVQAWVDARGDELYNDLRKEYEYLSSEESFIESCECNEITFEIEV